MHAWNTPEDAARWAAVTRRDRSSDGAFVYAVRTTRVYCRPSCPSRRPRPEHVIFFAAPEAAEGAGFRPCRRCRPAAQAVDVQIVERAAREMARRAGEAFSLGLLARSLCVSTRRLTRAFHNVLDVSPRQYADARRLEAVKGRLRAGEPVAGAMYDSGYGSSSRLYERAPRQLGMTPAAYRRGAPGVEIRFAIASCPIGMLLVAATTRGICRVSLGDSEEALLASLRSEFPKASLLRGQLEEYTAALIEHLGGRRPCPGLPLDVRATAFQRRVWEHLRRIPVGETRSYAEVARAMGHPTAARAVARACASNPTAIVIPCHRVVRGDGVAGGYRWGAARKEALLEAESAMADAACTP